MSIADRLEAAKVLKDDLLIQVDDAQMEIDELEAELEEEAENWDGCMPDDVQDIIDEDNASRAADMNETLRDIGGGL